MNTPKLKTIGAKPPLPKRHLVRTKTGLRGESVVTIRDWVLEDQPSDKALPGMTA